MTTNELTEIGIDLRAVDVGVIRANDYNPSQMEAETLENLKDIVKDEGMNQPVVVREDPANPGKFIIVDGEHRWRSATAVGLTKIAVVVVPWDETKAKLRTLSFNAMRGQNVPIKLARLIVDLQKTYTVEQIEAMSGIRRHEQDDVLKLLAQPHIELTDAGTVQIGTSAIERPISITLMLMPDEAAPYKDAMIKAMELAGDDVVALTGADVDDYSKAMRAGMGLAGTVMRNVALAAICEVFNEFVDTETKDKVSALIKARIKDKATPK